MTIVESVGKVITPCEVDQSMVNLSFGKVSILTESLSTVSKDLHVEVNGKITRFRIDEVDTDWVPIKYSAKGSTSDEEDDNEEEDDSEDYTTDTVPMDNNNDGELEDGEFIIAGVDALNGSVVNNANSYDKIRSPEVMSSPTNVEIHEYDLEERKEMFKEA